MYLRSILILYVSCKLIRKERTGEEKARPFGDKFRTNLPDRSRLSCPSSTRACTPCCTRLYWIPALSLSPYQSGLCDDSRTFVGSGRPLLSDVIAVESNASLLLLDYPTRSSNSLIEGNGVPHSNIRRSIDTFETRSCLMINEIRISNLETIISVEIFSFFYCSSDSFIHYNLEVKAILYKKIIFEHVYI